MSDFIDILKSNNIDKLRDFLLDTELEFYNNDTRDIVISLGFSILNYNKLTSLLEIYDNVEPCETDMFS